MTRYVTTSSSWSRICRKRGGDKRPGVSGLPWGLGSRFEEGEVKNTFLSYFAVLDRL